LFVSDAQLTVKRTTANNCTSFIDRQRSRVRFVRSSLKQEGDIPLLNDASLTGRVVDLKVETDGYLRIALADATGDKPGIVVVEVPAKPQWCEIRQTVFNWTRTGFPLHIQTTRTLNIRGDASHC
jgi:hypothetical protein